MLVKNNQILIPVPIVKGSLKLQTDGIVIKDDSEGLLFNTLSWHIPKEPIGIINYETGEIKFDTEDFNNQELCVDYRKIIDYIWIPKPKSELFGISRDKRFYRVFDNKNYYIFDSEEEHILPLNGLIDQNTVFYNGKFNDDYILCQSREDINALISKWHN